LSGYFEGSGVNTMMGQNWPVVSWLIKVQMALTMLVALLTALLVPGNQGWFVFLGGSVATLLGAVAALRTFSADARIDPQAALMALYRGLAAKLIGAVLFFVIIAKTMPQQLVYTVIGFGAATLSYWIALLWAPLPPAPTFEPEQDKD